jgi:hypothetical protein
MGKKRNYSPCVQCKYFVEDDESLKNTISYCILLGINIDDSGFCPEFVPLTEQEVNRKMNIDQELFPDKNFLT